MVAAMSEQPQSAPPAATRHPAPIGPGDHVFLVDGSSFVFRAYFQSMNQDRKYNYRSDGLPTGAVRLFCTKLLQFVREGAVGIRPTHLAIIFDKSENSFRKAIYPPYKANRPEPPADLIPQFPLMRAAVRAFGMIPVEQDVYEADDLIATYARQANAAGADVLIISADKDLMQLIRPGVAMYDPASGEAKRGSFRAERRIGYEEVVDYFGVPPDKVVDVQALAGDSTDNVPGVPGIGIKTAAGLILEYGDLETLLERAGEIKQPKRRENLQNARELALVSKQLVKLVDDVAVEVPLADLGLVEPDAKAVTAFLKALEFTTLTRRVADMGGVDVSQVDPDPAFAIGRYGPSVTAAADGGAGPMADNMADTGEAALPVPVAAGAVPAVPAPAAAGTPASLAAVRATEATTTPFDRDAYETVTTIDALDRWIDEAREQGLVALDTETNALDAMQADLVGFSLATAPGRACYVPLAHRSADEGLFGGGPVAGQIPLGEAIARLKTLAEDRTVLKIGQNLKYDWLVLVRYGIEVAPFDDTMLISYALDAGDRSHGMDDLSVRHLGHTPIPFKEVAGSGKNAVTFDRVPLDKATAYAAEDADVTLRLWRVLKPRLAAESMTTVYERLERPLLPVLARMERRGVAIDRQILSRLSGEFAQGMARAEAEIADLAGEPFNVASPKQLGDILFGKMGLPGAKKTKTGAWATGADVLEELAAQGYALPAKILEWRQLAKLKSTYTDALPGYVNPETGRVHTSFSLASTTTGRLSSSEPNIQNIPVRNEEGRKIRSAFIAEPGHLLLSADYSQIELRVLAEIADIPQLKTAFEKGIDIHALTASEMFGVPVEGMDPAVRRRAKAINFGIIYGISAFGLANQLGIPREEAGAYIRRYFERFPGIRDYMDETKAFARAHGYVETLFGRRAHYPEITSSNPSMRAFMERAAINARIQGSAADIIRRAMIRMEPALAAAGLSARMLLQVHDELVFEVPEAEVDATAKLVVDVMEVAPKPAVDLSVPLKVDARAAHNWDEAH
ncbi:DNA polymerase I [Pseudoxanthobacter soli DSM 19599]|uniref:DNA polymerase I n=2 Tax=Pseudoxanthobacter TaxID=433838 RepID=A0A1M7ZJ47_9HYPH|nr:DNA polymerase I [Pseudoxanthobacter soli DSM 19599]